MSTHRYRTSKEVIINRAGETALVEAVIGRIIGDVNNQEWIIMGQYYSLVPILDEDLQPVLDVDDNPMYEKKPLDKIHHKISDSVVDALISAHRANLTATNTLASINELKAIVSASLLAQYNSAWEATWDNAPEEKERKPITEQTETRLNKSQSSSSLSVEEEAIVNSTLRQESEENKLSSEVSLDKQLVETQENIVDQPKSTTSKKSWWTKLKEWFINLFKKK